MTIAVFFVDPQLMKYYPVSLKIHKRSASRVSNCPTSTIAATAAATTTATTSTITTTAVE